MKEKIDLDEIYGKDADKSATTNRLINQATTNCMIIRQPEKFGEHK
ncbi:MAG: hypothetical protein Q7K21_07970 [Elusimicrobiota bacterium]|nr:hypothetical protein [Elusimicrobiota bacterium]